MYFNPFNKITNSSEIGLLNYEDLEILATIDEGYSIEYKSSFSQSVKTEKLPKSVSAFSNSSGGWLFIGVNNSGVVVDIDIQGITLEGLYALVKSKVSPTPIFNATILPNPKDKTKGVIAIYVEEGRNSPYISNGSIFVRNGKESSPAERATIDLLLKKSYDYSNLSLHSLNAADNEFAFITTNISSVRVGQGVLPRFHSCISGCSTVGLYLKNDGKHFDENIELTIKVPQLYYFDIKTALISDACAEYENLFEKYTELPTSGEVSSYVSPRLVHGPFIPPLNVGSQYQIDYTNYILDIYFSDLEVFYENGFVYIKILFKGVNPGQKMFLPVKLLLKNGLEELEYSITSRFSMERINGKLLRRGE